MNATLQEEIERSRIAWVDQKRCPQGATNLRVMMDAFDRLVLLVWRVTRSDSNKIYLDEHLTSGQVFNQL